jgi:hypothetical protein
MANALTFIMPLAEGVDPRKVQEALGGLKQQIDDALNAVDTVHFARFVMFDRSAPNLLPSATGTGPFSLAIITSYDGDFGIYIQDFVNKLGPIFDELLAFSADGTDIPPVAQNVEAFKNYITGNDASQQPGSFALYSAYPQSVVKIKAKFPPS